MKALLFGTILAFTITLHSTKQAPTLLVQMPELATNFAMIDEPVEGPNGLRYGAKIFLLDGGIVSEFHDCAHNSGPDEYVFHCVNGNEELFYFVEDGINLLSWQTPTQTALFESQALTGRFEQITAYLLELRKTEVGSLSASIIFGDIFEGVYSDCKGEWLQSPDFDAEIYCANPDGTDVLIIGVKEENKLVLTGMWSTPKLPNDKTYFRGEISLEEIANMLH